MSNVYFFLTVAQRAALRKAYLSGKRGLRRGIFQERTINALLQKGLVVYRGKRIFLTPKGELARKL